MDNGSFRPHHTRSRQDWRVAQSSPNIDREFSCYFLDDGTVLECRAEQLRSLFVVAFRTMFPLPCRGLGRNWYFFIQPQKNLSQTMVRWSEMPSSTTLPSPSMIPIPYPSYVDLLYPSPTQTQTVQMSTSANSIVDSIPIDKVRQLQ